ncbi:MAG TPA: CBS domain-containing protein [Candidatus Nitrosotenuis sp.]|jgi:predicted transcriptional regulator|nr:CBS domain-containing protein [Candidatus Nitrosotenuis sp.]
MNNGVYSFPVFTLTDEDSVYDALEMMKTNFIKRVVIVKKKKPIGIVTELDLNQFLENDSTSRTLDQIQLKEIMKKNVITVRNDLDDHLTQCATRMDTFKIGSIVVVDDFGDLAGITTETDISRHYARMFPGKFRVRDYMTDKIVTCRDSDSLHYALDIINKNQISRLIVTDNNGNPKGTITTNDFLRYSQYFKRSLSKVHDELSQLSSEKNKVGEFIRYEILTVEPDDDLATAAELMVNNNVSGIPVIVIKNNKISGIITKSDIVRAFSQVITHGKLLEKYRTFH